MIFAYVEELIRKAWQAGLIEKRYQVYAKGMQTIQPAPITGFTGNAWKRGMVPSIAEQPNSVPKKNERFEMAWIQKYS
ncbi:hypothetical protein [Peribacillus sp. SCS-155]|uniref:hypothetical protein n=1 Tax=Peribacillus sedimenti TaxID=3115297 RepID=UPI003906436E